MANMTWATFETMVTTFVYLGVASFVGSYIAAFCLERSSERQVCRAKQLYFESIVRQDMGYFDQRDIGTLAADIETSTIQVKGFAFSAYICLRCCTSVLRATHYSYRTHSI
eukprot:Blabericola_migrator_1__9725@NODE_5324_length_806_cov_266_277402_g3414_i0_p1_GENE_NODE_5324_length_806_cov_266_277402_g3414_i0NODE_5324_length_806_cov_266_277402_g3414_i0_p1_ORF_typecomplete_len111_score14_67ABC_membrane/PF00664_23/1_4e12zfCRD/PF17979_1/0_019_NODE_5324_length_806_cov_266_277402_g3414_i0133465